MLIRPIEAADWTAFFRLFREIGPYRPARGSHVATASFMVSPTVPEAFDSTAHGRVGLHVMPRYL